VTQPESNSAAVSETDAISMRMAASLASRRVHRRCRSGGRHQRAASVFPFGFRPDSAVIPAGIRLERRLIGCAVSTDVGRLDRVLGFSGNFLRAFLRGLGGVLGGLGGGLAGFLRRASSLLGAFLHGPELRERGTAGHTERGDYQ